MSYTINIRGLDTCKRIHKECLEDAIYFEDEENINYHTNVLNTLKKWDNPVEVSTLEEYFSILNTAGEITEGEYSINNNGTEIYLGGGW